VVTDGAAISLVFALYSPALASMGELASTPPKTVIPAVAPTADENRHVYDEGSKEPLTLKYSAWLKALPPMLLSRLIRVHPSGVEIDPPPESRAVTTPIRTSPSEPPGWATVSDEAREVQAVALPLSTIEPSFAGGTNPCSSARKTRAWAGEAEAANRAAPTKAMQAAFLTSRWRLPSMVL
jgi:hypothetical protein